ncbi:MAG: S-adenosylmethionine:tRNA ribosyltransferase-isomerase, partial [Planctomycetota bacterium]
PPYILAARRDAGEAIDRPEDLDRYQTTFAGGEVGSVAAPTAGMHLTGGVFERLRGRGVERAEVTLHVGAGTFKPIETELVEAHPMHSEWCSMDGDAARLIFDERRAGRVVAVGSTSARTIESYAREVAGGAARPGFLETDLLITPGYRWRRVDALVTNFHLPRSTLLAMVASFLDQGGARGDGLERLLAVYAAAVREGYRFFSYGDAMVILP